MGRKGQSQAKTIKKTLGSDGDENDLNKYFNQMIGVENADPSIVIPKYNQLMDLLVKIKELFDSCIDIIGKIPHYDDGINEMREYNSRIANLINTRVLDDNFQPSTYAALKDHDSIHIIIESCSAMSDIHAHLKREWTDVDKKFFMRYNASEFAPFSFAPNLDFKRIWLIDCNENEQLMEYVFTFMKTCFKNMHAVYKCVTSPDVDVSNLSRIIVNAISNLKKHIPRCEKAFKKIEESVGMLENNFDSYYKDFVQTKDPSNILTAFISDVASNTSDTDVQLIIECRKIVAFYNKNARKQAANGGDNGRTSEKIKMFDALMSKYNMIEKKALNAMNINETDIDDNDDNDDKPPETSNTEDRTDEIKLPDIETLLSQINNPNVMNINIR